MSTTNLETALAALRAGEVSLARAAEIAGLDHDAMVAAARAAGIVPTCDPEDLADLRGADVRAAAGAVRPSSCAPSAWDVDVTVRIGPTAHRGEVTLAPSAWDGRPAAWGDCADMWVSGDLLTALRALPERQQKDALYELEIAARAAIEASDVALSAPASDD